MTRILIFSDLHLNHRPQFEIPAVLPEFDFALIAGDIDHDPETSMRLLGSAPALQGKEILYLPGNHEFYGGNIDILEQTGLKLEEETGVTWLHMRAMVYGDIRFIGATLWTDYELHDTREFSMRQARLSLNDHNYIITNDALQTRTFMPADARARHVRELAFIHKIMSTPFEGKTVVMTHHGPHPRSIEEKYIGSEINPAFVSDLTSTIEEFQPALWIHGHVHSCHDYMVGNTRIIANPRGYDLKRGGGVRMENPAFNPELIIEI